MEDRTGEITEVIGSPRHIGPGLAYGFPVVHRLHHSKLFRTGINQVSDLHQYAGTIWRADILPASKGLPGGLNRQVNVFFASIHTCGQKFTIGGAEGLEGFPFLPIYPFSIYEELVTCIHRLLHRGPPFICFGWHGSRRNESS